MSIFGQLLYTPEPQDHDDRDLSGCIGVYNPSINQSSDSGEPVFPEYLFLRIDRRGRYMGSGFYGMSETNRTEFTGTTFKKFTLDIEDITNLAAVCGGINKQYKIVNERQVDGNIERCYQLKR